MEVIWLNIIQKNAYTTIFDYNQENYYDIVTLIIEQLINYGPDNPKLIFMKIFIY